MDRLDTLLGRFLEQELTAEEEAELNGLLLESKEARRRFWAASEVDMMLQNIHEEDQAPVPAVKKRRLSPLALAGMVCLLGMLLLLGWQTIFNNNPSKQTAGGDKLEGNPLASVGVSRQADWQSLDGNYEGPLPAGEYHLKAGVIQLHWPSGATAALEGPARFALKETEVLDLLTGQAGVHVPPAAIGFVVRTPNGDVVDHGTDFGVRVSGDKTDAHLFAGEIEVVSGAQRMRLREAGTIAFRGANDLSQGGAAKPATFPLPQQERVLMDVTGAFDTAAKWGNGKPKDFAIWDGDQAEVVLGAFEGVRPQDGAGMLRFIASTSDSTAAEEIASQHIYWIDLAPYRHLVERGAVSISLTCSFNRIKGDTSTDTRFGLLSNVYKGTGMDNAERIRQFGKIIHANDDEKDWEWLHVSGTLPQDTTMVEFEIHAYENVNNNVESGEVEFAGHFADSLEARLIVDLRSANGSKAE